MKAYQAYAKGSNVVGQTPREAATRFFEKYPTKRKCNVIEGTVDDHFFTVTYGRSSDNEWPYSARDITKKMIQTLPHIITS